MYPDWQKIDVSMNAHQRVIIRDVNNADDDLAPPGDIAMQTLSLHEDMPERNQMPGSPSPPE